MTAEGIGGGILRTRSRYSSSVPPNGSQGSNSESSACNGSKIVMSEATAAEATTSASSSTQPKVRTLADLASSSAGLTSEVRGITEGGNVISHKPFIPKSIGQTHTEGEDGNHLSLKSTLLISDEGIPYITGLSGSEPAIDDANSVIALGVMGEDGQRVVRFCEYVDDEEDGAKCASSSKDRLGKKISYGFDKDDANNNEEDDNSNSDGSSSLGSAPDEEILQELGLSELILDDDECGSEDASPRITIDSKKLRSFRILWELLSRWATPSTVELVLRYQGKHATPLPEYEETSSNPSSVQYIEDISSECSRNIIDIGASRLASIITMLKMQIPRSLIELRNVQMGKENSIIDQRMAEQRLADLVRTFDPSAPAADLNMKLWKGLTTILIVIAFPGELCSSIMDECDDLLPPSIRRLNMASAEYRYLTRSVFSSLSGNESIQ